MTLRRCDSLPTRLQDVSVPVDPKSQNSPKISDSNTAPHLGDAPVREEIIATWKSLLTDVKKIKNGFPATHEPTSHGATAKESITPNFIPAFSYNNRDVRRKIAYDNRHSEVREAERVKSHPLDAGQMGIIENGNKTTRRKSLLQRLLSWRTRDCDCRELYQARFDPRELCSCGAIVSRANLPSNTSKCSERGRSKSVGYEIAREVNRVRRSASAGATVGLETAAALRARAALTLARRYYPEGGWGWTITVVGTIVQVLSHGLQLGGGTGPIACTAAVKYNVSPLYTHVPELKKRWKHFRDHYKKKTKMEPQQHSTWEYMPLLTFLSDTPNYESHVLQGFDDFDNMIEYQTSDEDTNEENQCDSSQSKEIKQESTSDHDPLVFEAETGIDTSSKKGIRQFNENYSDPTLKSKLSVASQSNSGAVDIKDPYKTHVHKFFDSMADIVSQFPPQLAAEARLRVCQVVNEIELKNLINNT